MLEDIKSAIIKAFIVLVVVVAIILGYGFFWVWYQTTGYKEQNYFSYKPQEWPGYKDTVEGSVPVEQKELTVKTRELSKYLKNPIPNTASNNKAGEEYYLIYCGVCHGDNGDGRGLMGSVPNLAPVPTKENDELQAYLKEFIISPVDIDLAYVGDALKDGEIYYTITNGGESIMPSFKDALNPFQRWQLVNYIKWRFLSSIEKHQQ